MNKPEAAASVSEVQQVVSTAVAEVQKNVTKALATELGMADLASDGRFAGFGKN
jgi:Flp pilus assembly secretin CpaC